MLEAGAPDEKRIQVRYKGGVVGECDPNRIVNRCVAIEPKVSPQYDKRDEAQLLDERKATCVKSRSVDKFRTNKSRRQAARLLICVSSLSICG
jgi:hypothetical protein